MSIGLDSTDAISRTASVPLATAFTMGAWLYFNALPAADRAVFGFTTSSTGEIAMLRWDTSDNKFRLSNATYAATITTNPGTATWAYFYIRSNGTNIQAGWKTIAEESFNAGKQCSTTYQSATAARVFVGANPLVGTSADMLVYRVDLWNEFVSDANLLLAAATDKGYTTNLNSHLPLYQQIASPYADTSGNGRDWTVTGTHAADQADPFASSSGKPGFYFAQL